MGPERAGWQPAADTEQSPRPRAGRDQPNGVSWTDQPRRQSSQAARSAERHADNGRPAVSVLADRLAAALVHHEPGWRLPRHSALARRYNVSLAEIDTAIDELIARHLIRRLADGQLYRASPAEYLISLEGISGLVSYVDTMGGDFTCRSRQITWRLPPEDIGWALRLPPAQHVCVVRFVWEAGGEPAALSTTYLPGDVAPPPQQPTEGTTLPAVLNLLQLSGFPEATEPATVGLEAPAAPGALHIEMQAPPPSVARSLRLAAGQPAVIVTVRFDDQETGNPVALTMTVLRPDMFRVVVQSPRPPLPDTVDGNLPGSWAHAAEDWEP
jgi:DNA-binding GntR family transcriptional regulator